MKDKLFEIYRPIHGDLKAVEGVLSRALKRTEHKSILAINQYVLGGTGKFLRPALVVLAARAAKPKMSAALKTKVMKLASAVELIHLASLVHDDLIDHAHIRHNRPTVNVKWGPEVSVALGDYLYSTAFELIGECDHVRAMSTLTKAIREISEGELIQICERDNHSLLKKRYLDIIRKKTGCLFSASCEVGARMADAGEAVARKMAGYGLCFGMAFQIIDDLIDLVGEEESLGKVPRQDLSVGELTLPILHLLESVPDKEAERIKNLILSKNIQKTIVELKDLFEQSRSLEKTRETILFYIKKSQALLGGLTESPYRDALINLTHLIYYERRI